MSEYGRSGVLNAPGYGRFNDQLQAITGNPYEAYVPLCSGMDVLRETHLKTPERSASGYATVFGLSRILDSDDVFLIQQKAIQNRYIAALLAYTEVSDQSWVMDNAGGVICVPASDPFALYHLSVGPSVELPDFILRRGEPQQASASDVVRMSDQIYPEKNLLRLSESGTRILMGVSFVEITRGYDIGLLSPLREMDRTGPIRDMESAIVMPPSPEPERPTFSPQGPSR